MTLDWLLLNGNAAVCALITLRLMFFQETGRHRPALAFLAWLMILAGGWIAFRIWFGQYVQVDPAELMLNSSVLVAVWRSKGNIAGPAGVNNAE